ncbi:MAG: hypothetical protein KGJ60_15595, partial [Verrucomicrobiota bacterium]|nr:hypothetical protein [Verrucomicrobiota bacterium]
MTRLSPAAASAGPAEYAWAEYLHCMEGTPDVECLPERPAPSIGWGLTACLLLTAGGMWVYKAPIWPFTLPGGGHPFEPVMMVIVLGMI